MSLSLIKSILILPGNVAMVIPALVLWFSHGTSYGWRLADPSSPWFWIALALFAIALVLMVGTVNLFVRAGRGTPAPWDPPTRLVVTGIYRHVRNPMISGMTLLLLGEAAIFQSLPLLGWGRSLS